MVLPENITVQTALPENVTVQTALPENVMVQTALPENVTVQTVLPENIPSRNGMAAELLYMVLQHLTIQDTSGTSKV